MIDVLVLALLVPATLVGVVIASLRSNRVVGSLRKRFPDEFRQGQKIGPVCYVSDTDLPRLQSMKQPLSGVFLQQGRALEFIGANATGDVPKRVAWNLDDVQLTLIKASPMSLGVPDLIRVAQGGQVHFFFARNVLGSPSRNRTLGHFETLRSALGTLNHGVEEAAGSKVPMTVAAAVVLLLVGVLVASAIKKDGLIGPRLVAPDGRGGLFMATGRDILRLGEFGDLVEAAGFEELGIAGGVAAIGADGEGRLLVADSAAHQLKRCALADARCEVFPGFEQPAAQFRRAASFALDPRSGVLYLSDTARHRIVRLDADGSLSELRTVRGRQLCFPNGVALSRDGGLLWADTNNFRVLHWPDAAGWSGSEPAEHMVVARPPESYRCVADGEGPTAENAYLDRTLRYQSTGEAAALPLLHRGSVWVSELSELPDGRWWAIMNRSNMRYGEVVLFSADWEAERVAALPPGADPWDIAVLGGRLLVSDPDNGVIHEVDQQGQLLAPFAAATLQARYRGERQAQETWGMVYLGSLFGVSLVLIALMAAALWLRKRRVNEILSMPA